VLHLVRADRLVRDVQVAEDRRALECGAAAVGAVRNLVALMQGDGEATLVAAEAARAGERPRIEGVKRFALEHRADDNGHLRCRNFGHGEVMRKLREPEAASTDVLDALAGITCTQPNKAAWEESSQRSSA
jgi:hypothetical protein